MANVIIPASAPQARIPLNFLSQLGRQQPVPLAGATIASSDVTKVTAAFSADNLWVVLKPVAAGTGITITYTAGQIVRTITVDIAVLAVVDVEFNIAGMVVDPPASTFVS